MLVDQFFHFHPVAITELEAALDRLQVAGAELECGSEEFATFGGGLDFVRIRLGRDGVPEAGELTTPRCVGLSAQGIIPIVMRGVEQACDFIFAGGRFVCHTDDPRHLAGARGDSQAFMRGGTRFRGNYRLLQQGSRLYLRSLAKLSNQDERKREHPRAGERPADTGIPAGREETRQTEQEGLRCQFGFDPVKIEAAPRFRRGRQVRDQHILAVSHAIADGGLQFGRLGAALPAGFEMSTHLTGLTRGQFAIQIAQEETVIGVAQVEITHRAPS